MCSPERRGKRTNIVAGTCGWAVSTGGAQVPGDFDAVNYTRLIRGKGRVLIGSILILGVRSLSILLSVTPCIYVSI
jgi:hypothetical protein